MSNVGPSTQLPNNASPPLTPLIEISNADVSQHTSLRKVVRQNNGYTLISINGLITYTNNAITNANIAAYALTTPKH